MRRRWARRRRRTRAAVQDVRTLRVLLLGDRSRARLLLLHLHLDVALGAFAEDRQRQDLADGAVDAPAQFQRTLLDAPIGNILSLTILREGAKRDIKVQVEQQQARARAVAE